MLKQKDNKFYIGKEEVTLFAIYLPDLFTDVPSDYYFYFNPKNNKFEMASDNSFAYWASQVFYDSSFIVLAQYKKSERIDLINDKTFLFKYFSDTMDNDEDRQIFLEHGKEEIDKIHASYENMKRLLAGVGAGLFDSEKYIVQWLQKEYGENLIFSITPNDYGYLLKIHEYNKVAQYLHKSNFNKDWGKKRVKTELNNLKYELAFQRAITRSLESVKEYEKEIIKEKAKNILSDCNIGKIDSITSRIENNEIIMMARLILFSGDYLTIHFAKDFTITRIAKSIKDKGQEEIIDGITYIKPGSFTETFANISTKINLEETDKWLPILDKL